MNYPYDRAVIIGRFQPFHNGHAALLQFALNSAPTVNIILGSAFSAPSAKNPFSWEERAALINSTLDDSLQQRIIFMPVPDYHNDRLWTAAIKIAVNAPLEERVALIGHPKDSSSYYLRNFPEWEFIAIPKYADLDAATVRRIWFEGSSPHATRHLLAPLLSEKVVDYLSNWPQFNHLRAEYFAIVESQKTWGLGPFVTVDSVVRAADNVLLIRRGRHPGQGLFALPGGFIERNEFLFNAAIRELREETNLAVAENILRQALIKVAVFDHPERSQRGRTITHAHFFDLPDATLPNIQGADDAAVANWIPLQEIPTLESQFFEDHFNILDYFFNLRTRDHK